MKLYQKKEKTFPSSTEIDGILYDINADFRNILRIFAILRDAKVPETKRAEKLIQWFFGENDAEKTGLTYDAAVQAFSDFINRENIDENKQSSDIYDDKNEAEQSERQYDYDFDAEEIYAGFMSEYNIDLVEVGFLHWYKFKILLGNLSGESAFKKKIELRFMDLSIYKGQALADMTRAKESVQLPVEYSEEELRQIERFDNVWGNV